MIFVIKNLTLLFCFVSFSLQIQILRLIILKVRFNTIFQYLPFIGHIYGRCLLRAPKHWEQKQCFHLSYSTYRLYAVIWSYENKCVNLKPHISTMQCLQLAERGNRAFLIFLSSEVKCNPIILKWAVKQLPIIKGIKLLI